MNNAPKNDPQFQRGLTLEETLDVLIYVERLEAELVRYVARYGLTDESRDLLKGR